MTIAENYDTGGVGSPVKDTKKEVDVSTPCHEYEEMMEAFELPDALLGGTRKIKAGRTQWLPQEPKEKLGAYNNRLKRTVLYNAYGRTVKALAGLPFVVPVSVEDIPPSLSYITEDADSMGKDLTNLAYSLLTEQIHYGITHLLVDMPAIEGKITLKQQQDYKLRPYFSQISPTNLISWSYKKEGGKVVLTEIRIKEEVYEKDGEWGEKKHEQIRVVTPEAFTIYRKNDKTWVVNETIPNRLGFIPLVTIYGNQDNFMTATPAMEDLAWLNLRHYQKLSDQDNIIHVASVPILFGRGFEDGEMDGISIGPNTLITASKEQADLKYVEHTGAAINAAERSIERLEERMAALGADLIIRKSVDRQTATSRKIDQSESISMLQVMINNLESGLQLAIHYASKWINENVDNVIVNIGDGLDSGDLGANTLDILATFIIENNGMSVEQAINELKRRGALSDTYKLIEGLKTNFNKPTGEIPNQQQEAGA